MSDGRIFAATVDRDSRKQVSLCDWVSRNDRCWGHCYSHKKYGVKADGRDEGKVIAMSFSCEGHRRAGVEGLSYAYDRAPNGDMWWEDGYAYSFEDNRKEGEIPCLLLDAPSRAAIMAEVAIATAVRPETT